MKILVTQPYIPTYRVPLFSRIAEILDSEGHQLIVAGGEPDQQQALRGDQERPPWSCTYASRTVAIGGRHVISRTMPRQARDAHVVVSELEALNVFAWRTSFGRTPLILWGHGKAYVNDSPPIADRIEWSLARRAAHIMTYVESGRREMIDRGRIKPSSITAIGNSTDTAALRNALADLSNAERQAARERVGPGLRALFVGGLDRTKRIDFLLAAAEQAARRDPQFGLIIIGRGEMESLVIEQAANSPHIVYIPSARGRELAALSTAADAVWMPGRVGLVAVDALALGLPLHTTRFRYHAPEIELLHEDEVSYLADDPGEFAAASVAQMAVGRQLHPRQKIPTIDSVANSFARVVLEQLERQHPR